MVCFSVVSPQDINAINKEFIPELQKHAKNKPFILVGTKSDLSLDQTWISDLQAKGTQPLSDEDGQKLADKLGAEKYVSVSSKTMSNLTEAFGFAAWAATHPKKSKKTSSSASSQTDSSSPSAAPSGSASGSKKEKKDKDCCVM